ncbi:MAG: phage major capsid protein [Pirellulales bacterium]|nr:phage major capsid protein [Pirellulales bacterium]
MPAPAKTSKQLREERAPLVTRMKELRDKHHDPKQEWTAEDRANWEKVNADYNDLTRQIEEVEASDAMDARLAAVEGEQRQPAGDPRVGRENLDSRRAAAGASGAASEEDRAVAMQGWCRRQMDQDVEPRHEEAAARCGLRLDARQLTIPLFETQRCRSLQRQLRSVHPERIHDAFEGRAMSATLGGSGGGFVPEGFVRSLEVALLAFGGIRQAAEIFRTETGEPTPWPTMDDTTNEGELVGESKEVATADPKVGQVLFHAHKYSSKAVLVPQELLEDSAFDLPSILGAMLGERLGRITAKHCTTGDGNGRPFGIVPAATVGKTTAAATAITYDELLGLEHSVDPAYRIDSSYMMHDNVILALRLLKDENGLPLWQSNIAEGRPDRLGGRPIFINQAMDASLVANAKTVLFGQLSKFKIREVRGVRLYRLQERYREKDQDGFVAFLRLDGHLLDAGSHPVKALQQHA